MIVMSGVVRNEVDAITRVKRHLDFMTAVLVLEGIEVLLQIFFKILEDTLTNRAHQPTDLIKLTACKEVPHAKRDRRH